VWTLVYYPKGRIQTESVWHKVLTRISGPKKEEVTGRWRKLYKEIHDVYSSPYIVKEIRSRRMRRVGHAVHVGEMRNAYQISVRKTEGMISLWRPRRRWEYNITMDLQERQ
jgi:hypothetical protein